MMSQRRPSEKPLNQDASNSYQSVFCPYNAHYDPKPPLKFIRSNLGSNLMVSSFPPSRSLAVPTHPRFAGGTSQKQVESSAKRELSQEAAHVLPSLTTIGIAGITTLVGAFAGSRFQIVKQMMEQVKQLSTNPIARPGLLEQICGPGGAFAGFVALPLTVMNWLDMSVLKMDVSGLKESMTQHIKESSENITDLGKRITYNFRAIEDVEEWAQRNSNKLGTLSQNIDQNWQELFKLRLNALRN